ncbi:MAG: hypothetical protein ACLR4A_16980 [Christensenellales bacterium]
MDALRLHIRRESDDVRRCLKALDGRFEPYGEDYKKLAVPDDVPEDLRFLYVKNTSALSATARRQSGRCCTRAAWRT